MSSSYSQNGKTYHMKGFNVLVEMETLSDKLGSGILHAAGTDLEKRQLGHTRGILRAVGKDAWFDKGEPYAKIGDKVIFRRYAGDLVNRTKEGLIPMDEPRLIIMKDEEILGTIEE